MKDLIDLADRQQAFDTINERINGLKLGFSALSLDYGFHIENNFGGNHKIFELHENVRYRLFSAVFHFQLLLRQHAYIESRFQEINSKQPSELNEPIIGKNPHFVYSEQEISSILDSIVFHLSSIFDYLSILIQFTSCPDKGQTPKWSNITKSARDKNNPLSKKEIAKVIDDIDRLFINSLYSYRSKLIHTNSDIHNYSAGTVISTEKTTVRYSCTQRIRKAFRSFGDPELDYSVSYFSSFLINKSADMIVLLLLGLKKEIEDNSQFPFHTFSKPDKPVMIYVDPATNTIQSPSVPQWEQFSVMFANLSNG